jgi:cation diffusion facilitator CzcD-associated flavoprotein CzcO
MLEYLRGYAMNFGVDRLIRFRAGVTRLTPLAGRLDGRDQRRRHQPIRCGDRRHRPPAKPRWPKLPARFAGQYLHAASYRDVKPFVDRRVCIVGLGNSALDIATDLAHVAQRLVVSARTGAFIWPNTPSATDDARRGRVHDIPSAAALQVLARADHPNDRRAGLGPDVGLRINCPRRRHPISNQFFSAK